jgi:hypothetical protein
MFITFFSYLPVHLNITYPCGNNIVQEVLKENGFLRFFVLLVSLILFLVVSFQFCPSQN